MREVSSWLAWPLGGHVVGLTEILLIWYARKAPEGNMGSAGACNRGA